MGVGGGRRLLPAMAAPAASPAPRPAPAPTPTSIAPIADAREILENGKIIRGYQRGEGGGRGRRGRKGGEGGMQGKVYRDHGGGNVYNKCVL